MQKIDSFRGYFGIGIFNPKVQENIGTLWRHAYLYNASFIFTIGSKPKKQVTDTINSFNHIPLYYYETFEEFLKNIPKGCELIGIELDKKSIDLQDFKHPLNCIYLLGNEGYGLPQEIMEKCNNIIQVYSPKPQSMNVAVTGTLIIYDRIIKLKK